MSDVVVRKSSGGRVFLALLAGLVLGAVLTFAVLALDLLDLGDDADPAAAASETPTASPTATATGDVPPSCLAAAEHNATVSAALDGVAVGVRDQDALAIEEGLDAIAAIKPDMDAASQECRALAGVTDDSVDDSDDDSGDDSDDDGDDSGDRGDDSGPTPEPSPTRTP